MPATTMPDFLRTVSDLDIAVKGYVSETNRKQREMQLQLDAIDGKSHTRFGSSPVKSFGDSLKESESVARLLKDRKGHAVVNLSGEQVAQLMGRKTTVLLGGLGFETPGVVPAERMPTIVQEARSTLRVRDVLSARPTEAGLIYFVKVNQPLSLASPQVEGAVKAENAVTFVTASERVRTISTWIPMSKQAIDDFAELEGFLQASLPYYVNKEEELQLIGGDNTGENLHGLISQATAFDPSLLGSSSYTRIDQIGAAIEQIEVANEIEPSFIVLNPRDWWNLRRTKDGFGRYILGDPQTAGNPTLWNLATVSTTSMAPGTFLVGSGQSAAAEIRDRMEMQVEISTEHADFFTRNLVAIRAEKRLALVVMRPASFITGTFSSSPA